MYFYMWFHYENSYLPKTTVDIVIVIIKANMHMHAIGATWRSPFNNFTFSYSSGLLKCLTLCCHHIFGFYPSATPQFSLETKSQRYLWCDVSLHLLHCPKTSHLLNFHCHEWFFPFWFNFTVVYLLAESWSVFTCFLKYRHNTNVHWTNNIAFIFNRLIQYAPHMLIEPLFTFTS